MDFKKKKIGEILIEKGLINPEQLNMALSEQKRKPNEFLGAILIRKKYIKEDSLVKVLSEQFHLPVEHLEHKYLTKVNNYLSLKIQYSVKMTRILLALSIDLPFWHSACFARCQEITWRSVEPNLRPLTNGRKFYD